MSLGALQQSSRSGRRCEAGGRETVRVSLLQKVEPPHMGRRWNFSRAVGVKGGRKAGGRVAVSVSSQQEEEYTGPCSLLLLPFPLILLRLSALGWSTPTHGRRTLILGTCRSPYPSPRKEILLRWARPSRIQSRHCESGSTRLSEFVL